MLEKDQLRSVLTNCIEQVESDEIQTMEQLIEQLTSDLIGLTETTLTS